MNTIAGFAGNGTIGYVEYSYPLNKDYPVVKVLNKAGYYVEPTQYNIAVALTKAQINQDPNSPLYLTQILDNVYTNTDPRAYPISSYSYMIIPTGATDTRMTTAKRQTLADFLYYSLCAGQTKAGPYGYSPLPLNLVQAGFDQIAKLKVADPAVDLTDRDVQLVQQPDLRRQEPRRRTSSPRSRPQPAACDKDRRRARAAPTRAPTSRRPTTPNAPTAPPSRRADRTVEARRRPVPAPTDTGPVVDPDTGEVDHAGPGRPGAPARRHDHGAAGRRLPGADRARRLAAGRHRDLRLGRRRRSWSRWCCCPACWSSSLRRRPRRRGAAMSARRTPPRPVRGLRPRSVLRRPARWRWLPARRRRPATRRATCRRREDAARRRTRQTKTLTRQFVEDDGSTYAFPTNTVTVNASADQGPARSPADPDQLDRRAAQRRPGQQPLRRERAPAGVPGRHPAVPRHRRPDPAGRRSRSGPRPAGPTRWRSAPRSPVRRRARSGSTTCAATDADKEPARRASTRSRRKDVCPTADQEPLYTHLTPFVAASGQGLRRPATRDHMPPEAAVGAAFPPAEIAAFTDEDGTGSVQFEVRSDVENESLGCNDKVACSIVVIPINGSRAASQPARRPSRRSPTPPAGNGGQFTARARSNFANARRRPGRLAGCCGGRPPTGATGSRSRSPSACRRTPATSSTRGRRPASTAPS